MRKENVLVIALVCMAVAGLLFYQYSNRNESGFQTTGSTSLASTGSSSMISWAGYSEGMSSAKNENKHIFLYFHAEWCTYCTKLKKTTFKDKDVRKMLADKFISIAIDTDKHREIAKQWRVTGLPTMWFLRPDGTRISNIPGYVTADQMMKFLEFVHTQSYEKMKFHDFMKG